MKDIGYLYFSKTDYDFIKLHFPDIFAICKQYVSSREPDIELTVTDSQTDMIDNKVLMAIGRSEEHTSELQSRFDLVCRLLLDKKTQAAADGRSCGLPCSTYVLL